MSKRPDLRKPMAERGYEPVDRPIMIKVEKGFQLPSKEPCKECPLARTAQPGALGGYTPEQYMDVLCGPADLACHMSPGFPADRSRQRSCTGVAMFRANAGLNPDGKSASDAVKEVGPNRELVFADLAEFARHHGSKTVKLHAVHNEHSFRVVDEIFQAVAEAEGDPEDIMIILTSVCAGTLLSLEVATKGRMKAEGWGQVLFEELPIRLAQIRAKRAAAKGGDNG